MSFCQYIIMKNSSEVLREKETLWSFTRSSRKKGTSQVRDNSGNILLSLPKKHLLKLTGIEA